MAAFGTRLHAQSAVPVDDGFNPNPNGIVNSIVIQPDGKILMGGYFTQIHPDGGIVAGHGYLARLNYDGSVDTSFSPNANGVVRVLALQPNGQIVVGGDFTSVQPTGGGAAVTRNYLARLNADGTLDATFNPSLNGVVYAVAFQPNGQIIIGGAFTTVQAAGASTPVTRNRLARLNADGSLDTTFNPNANRTVLSVAVETSGQILVGGGFSTLQPSGAANATTRNSVARLNSDGSIDTGFDPEPNASVSAITVLPNGQVLLGGEFTSLQPNGATSGTQCDFLARLNTDGSLDTSFIVNPLASVSAIALEGDGKVIIGGTFTSVFPANSTSASAASYVARINTDGSVDTTFLPNPDQAVSALAIQGDGSIVLGGYFEDVDNTPRNFVARVGSTGSLDGTLAPDSQGAIYCSVTLSNGQMIIGGSFVSIGGVTQSYLARINANGTLDTTFAPVLDNVVQAVAVQANGQILVGGAFTEIDGVPRRYMARINTDGTLDGPFNPNPDGSVVFIQVQPSTKILISGTFNELLPNGASTANQIANFVRINNDATVDTSFNLGISGAVYAMATGPNGSIVIGGEFTSLGSTTRSYVARLNSDYTLDNSFDPEPNAAVYALAVQSDGKVLIGGAFTSIEPLTGTIDTKLPVQTTGVYGTQTLPTPGTNATTPIYVGHLTRLNTDGEFDTTYYPLANNAVLGMALQSDGSIVVGGLFTTFAPNSGSTVLRNYVAHVETNGTIDASFDPNANGQVDVVQNLSGGGLLIAGKFTTLQPNGAASPVPATHIAFLNSSGTINPSFTGSATSAAVGQVNAAALQPNGQMLVGGAFAPLGGAPGYYLATFNPDGSPTSFNANINGPVNAISVLPNGASTSTTTNYAVWLEASGALRYAYSASSNGEVLAVAQQANGKVLVGGTFTSFANSSASPYLVRLNTDGTVDATFNPPLNGQVNAIVIQPNGQIVIGGAFVNIASSTVSGSPPISFIARLNTDGTVDTSFNPAPNLSVTCLALQSNAEIILGGTFTEIEIPATTTTTTTASSSTTVTPQRNYIARVNENGTLDTSFNPDLNSAPSQIVVLASGQILVGGLFSAVSPNSGTSYIQGSLVRLNSDGTLDTNFNPDPDAGVTAIAVQANGQIIAGGFFTSFQPGEANSKTTITPITTGSLARINTDGTIDTTFQPTPNGTIASITVLPNQELVVVGNFTSFQPNGSSTPVSRDYIARINTNGTVDTSFDAGLNGAATSSQLLLDGSLFIGGSFTGIETGGAVLVGGSFNIVGGITASNLTRLNADSTVDSTFTSNPNGPVFALTPQTNADILVGGSFSSIGTQACSNIARLNPDGSVDTSFNPNANGTVDAIVAEPSGQILIGGSFTSVGGLSATYLARLAASGSPDPSFTPVINGTVNAVAVQQNGQIVIGGSFTSVDGVAVGRIARLNPGGTVDSSFNPNANGTVQAITLQIDGSIMAAGAFTTIGGLAVPYAARIESNGSVDTTFEPKPNGGVDAVLVQPDGKIFLGGSFTVVDGLSRYEIARLSTPTPVLQTLSASSDESTITWTRSGGAPVFASVKFEESLDGTHWTTVAQPTAVSPTTWQATGLAPLSASSFLVRATGVMPSSQFSSSGLVQIVQSIDILAVPIVNSAGFAAGTSGSPFSFTVTATQLPTYFSASGLPPGLTIGTASGIISGTPTGAGTYTVAVTAGNASGSSTSTLVITIGAGGATTSYAPSATSASDRLLNLSTRAELSGAGTMVAGFVVSGTGQKTVLLRAVGPGLSAFNVSNVMATPEIQLYSGSGTLMMQNSGWGGSSSLAATFAQVGAFSLSAGSADAALVVSLPAGPYTIHVFDPSGKGGVVLTEIYDASASPLTDTTRLVNISANASVSAGAGALIGGFVIGGTGTKSVIVRGVGPGLAGFGVTGWLADPVLSVFDSNDNLVAKNLAWNSQTVAGPYQDSVGSGNIQTLDALVGAFALSTGDTALVADLPPGAYTFQVTSASNSQGQALGEVYELP